MNAIIHFMYLGEASIEQNKVNEFFEIAEDLEVSVITNSQNSSEEVLENTNNEENTKILEEKGKNEVEGDGEIHENDTDVMFEDEYDVSNIYADAGLDPYDSSNSFSNPPAESTELVKFEENNQTFDCENCGSQYPTQEGLDLHRKLMHKESKLKSVSPTREFEYLRYL